MTAPAQITALLNQKRIAYEVIHHPPTDTLEGAATAAGIDTLSLARAVLVTDGRRLFKAVLTVGQVLDLEALSHLLGQPVKVASPEQVSRRDGIGKSPLLPCWNDAGAWETVVDGGLLEQPFVYFEPGANNLLIKLSGAGFRALHAKARLGRFAESLDRAVNRLAQPEQGADYEAVRRQVESLYDLPAMPAVAARILELHRDMAASADDLAQVIELDPSLSAQIIRYARSPLYGYRGRVDSIRDAIARVLGFDFVMHVSLGLAVGRSFRNPADGPLGLRAFWRHSVYCAALTQALAKCLPAASRPPTGMAYLAGLMHNLGFLLLGHLFQPEFYLLNKLCRAHPDVPVTQLETQVLGMGGARQVLGLGHAQLGAWLMESWDMPQPLITAVQHHHNAQYDGPNAVYVRLITIANHLLKRAGIGDAANGSLPLPVLAAVGLDAFVAEQVWEDLLASGIDELDGIARQMMAA